MLCFSFSRYKRPEFANSQSIPPTSASRSESVGSAPHTAAPVKVDAVPAKQPTAPTGKPAPSTTTTASTTTSAAASNPGFKAEGVLNTLKAGLNAETVAKVKAVFRFDVTKDGKTNYYLVDLKNGSGAISNVDGNAKSDCSIALSDDDFVALMAGKLNPQQAFMKGKLKLKGNMMLAQKLQHITPKSKL